MGNGRRMDPRTLKRWLIAVGVAYLVFPRDLIPDFLGRGIGLLDDLLLIGALTWFYRNRLCDAVEAGGATAADAGRRGQRQERREEARREPPKPPPKRAPDPYETLGVPRSASQDAIRQAYRARMGEYHPDKVAHLGEDLQRLAHEKALQIQAAYEQLRR